MSEPLTAEVLAHEPADNGASAEPSVSNGDRMPPRPSNDRARRLSDIKRPIPGDRTENGDNDSADKQEKKHPGAYERAKQRVAAKQAEQAKRDSALSQREAALNERERLMKEANTPKPKQRDYTLADLRKYHKQWSDVNHRNYDPDLAEKAATEIEVMEGEETANNQVGNLPKTGTPEHAAQWQQAEKELAQADPEFLRTGTKLDARLREIMQGPDGAIYRQHPRGIVAAYHQAKLDLTRAENSELSAKIQELETELKRYQGLTGISGGVSRRPGSSGKSPETPQEFARLSTKDMKRHLLSQAKSGAAPLF